MNAQRLCMRYLMAGLLVTAAFASVWRITQQPLAADFGQPKEHAQCSN